jgi:hypothetical protein
MARLASRHSAQKLGASKRAELQASANRRTSRERRANLVPRLALQSKDWARGVTKRRRKKRAEMAAETGINNTSRAMRGLSVLQKTKSIQVISALPENLREDSPEPDYALPETQHVVIMSKIGVRVASHKRFTRQSR